MEDLNIFKDNTIPSNSRVVNIESIKSKKNIEIKAETGYFIEKLYTDNFWDTKEYGKLIKNVERHIRTSREYKDYIGYLKNEIGLNTCAILGEIDHSRAEIEMHHYPFTLYDIVNIVAASRIVRGEGVTSLTLAHEVMNLHYENLVGIVPLSRTVHELAHSGEIFINLKQVFGDVNEFVKRYSDGLTDGYIDDFNKLVALTNQDTKYSETDILKKGRKEWNFGVDPLDISDL